MVKKSEEIIEHEHKNCSCGEECKCNRIKKSTWMIISLLVIVLVFCVGLGVGTFILEGGSSDKCIDAKEEKESLLGHDKGTNYFSDDIVKHLMNNIEYLDDIGFVNREISNVKDYTNQELLFFAMIKLEFEDVITLEQVNNLIKKYFGIEVVPENIMCPLCGKDLPAMYLYDEIKKEFVNNNDHGAHGLGEYISTAVNRIVELKVVEDQYYVYVKKAFSADAFLNYNYYKTLDDAKNKKNMIFGYDGNVDIVDFSVEDEFAKVENDKMNTYEYVFEKVNDDFVLKSYKLYK